MSEPVESSPALAGRSLPIPTNVESVAWAEEAMRLVKALRGLLYVIEADGLIPENVSYMRQAREVMKGWPEMGELPLPPVAQLKAELPHMFERVGRLHLDCKTCGKDGQHPIHDPTARGE